jgi:hypothetical protein
MMMAPRVRKLALTAHVTSSVGWLGTAAAFQALAIAALRSEDPVVVRGFYSAMALVGWYAIVPFCIASLVTGLVVSLGTAWGLFRYYWVAAKFLITSAASVILFGFTQTLDQMGALAVEPALSLGELGTLKQSPVLHSAGGLLVLLLTTVLAVYKPWGMTSYGRRNLQIQKPAMPSSNSTKLWRVYLLLGTLVLLVLFLILHLLSGGPKGHFVAPVR